MPNLVSLNHPSLQILEKTQPTVISLFGFLVKSLINKNCHNSRTSNDADMKLGPLTKIDKKNTVTSRKIYENLVSEPRFLVNLEQSGTEIRDPSPINLKLSLITTFYLTKTGNRTKKSLTIFLQKNADISKIKGMLVLKGIFSETKYKCVLSYQILSF